MKKLPLLSAALCLSFSLLLGMTSTSAMADWQPSGPITLKIGFKAGGGADTQARLIAEALESRYGWQVIPEQATGKGGLNLAASLKKSPNDGTAIGMVVAETMGYNMLAAPRAKLKLEDFTPLASTASFQTGIVAKSNRGWNSMHDVIADAKAGKQIKFGVMAPMLADLAYLLGKANDVEFNISSVKGGKAVMNGINADDIDVGLVAGIQNKAVAAGDMVNLASAIGEPLSISPNAPLLSDLGLKRFNAYGYFLFIAPANLPEEARIALSEAISTVVQDPSTKAHQFITKVFSKTTVLVGDELNNSLATTSTNAKALLAAAAE